MLIQLLYDYLLLILLLLPGSNQRSLNTDHLQRKNETAEENAKSISLLKVDNFVDGQCPPPTDSLQLNDPNAKCRDECRSDVDCIEDYKCCEKRCSFKCIEPWFPNRVVDWTKSPSLNNIHDGLELPDQRNGPWKYGGEPCSTSVLDGLQPLRCPTNHVCQIMMDGDIQLNIPNRGECVRIHEKKSARSEITNNANSQDFLTIDAECSDKEDTYKHQEKFRKNCNICVCHNGVVFCDNQPCPFQIGIPASIASYQEQRHPTEFISIDGEEDTEDASGSSAFGYSGEGPNARVTFEEIELGANTEGHNKEESEDDESAQEEDVSSGVSDQEHLGKVNGQDNDDSESSGYVIDLTDDVNHQEFSGESGSGQLETKDPTTTGPDSTSKTSESKISTSAQEISTLSPKILTSTRETTTPAPKSSILLPESSTESPEVEQYKTTESSKPVNITTTVDVIMLEKGVYERGKISLGKYSGDDEDESEENSGESSSDIYSGHPPPVYPDTIVLKPSRNQNLSTEANQESEFRFETDDARTDIDSAGSLNSEDVRTGDDGSASGNIVRNDDAKNTKQNSETLEYLKTTDDEN